MFPVMKETPVEAGRNELYIMETGLSIAQMQRGMDVEGFYLLKAAFSKVTASGKPFLTRNAQSGGHARQGRVEASRLLPTLGKVKSSWHLAGMRLGIGIRPQPPGAL